VTVPGGLIARPDAMHHDWYTKTIIHGTAMTKRPGDHDVPPDQRLQP
jgi:hypothetical protein